MVKKAAEKKYLSLAHRLESYLLKFPNGAKLPPMRAIAARYEMSMVTLNAALLQLERKGLIERRHGSGVFVQRRDGVKRLVLLRNDYASPIFDLRIQAVHETCHDEGWGLMVMQTSTYYPDDFAEIDGDYDGIILEGDALPRESLFFRSLLEKNIPMVQLGFESSMSGVDSVANDNSLGIRLLLKHLEEIGHRRVALLVNEYESPDVSERRRAFLELCPEMGLDFTVIECATRAGEEPSLTAIAPFKAHLQEYAGAKAFTAFIAVSDAGAIAILRILHEHGIPFSRRAVVGFDDTPISSMFVPSLTTLSWNVKEMARRGIELIKRRFEGDNSSKLTERIRPQLIVRESSSSRPTSPKIRR